MYVAVGFVTTYFSMTQKIFTGSRKIPLHLMMVKKGMHIRDILPYHWKVCEIKVSITCRVQSSVNLFYLKNIKNLSALTILRDILGLSLHIYFKSS